MRPRDLTRQLNNLISSKRYSDCCDLCLKEKNSFNIIHLSIIMRNAEQFERDKLQLLLRHVVEIVANQSVDFYVVVGGRSAASTFLKACSTLDTSLLGNDLGSLVKSLQQCGCIKTGSEPQA